MATADLTRTVKLLNTEFLQRYPDEAMRTASHLRPRELAEFLAHQPATLAAAVWERLAPDLAEALLEQLDDALVRSLLSASEPVHNARLLSRLRPEAQARLLKLLDPAKARELEELMSYAPDSAAALMDARYLPLAASMSAGAALQRIRRHKPRFTRQLYLVNDDGVLTQRVEIQDLALAKPGESLATLAKPVVAAVLLTANRDEVIAMLDQYKISDLPVVDVAGRLAGVIRYDALMEAVREESSADILTMVGVSKDERALSPLGFVVRKRLPWLEINLLTAFLAASVVGLFESTIAQFTALAVLLPVVAGQSGNAGAQALAVTMRGLALHEIGTSQWLRVLRKEVGAGLINGVAIALTTAVGVLVWSDSAGLALVIALAMVLAMVAAAFSGVIIPILLTKFGQDPAQSSSIILTTVTDVVGFFAFLGIASLLSNFL